MDNDGLDDEDFSFMAKEYAEEEGGGDNDDNFTGTGSGSAYSANNSFSSKPPTGRKSTSGSIEARNKFNDFILGNDGGMTGDNDDDDNNSFPELDIDLSPDRSNHDRRISSHNNNNHSSSHHSIQSHNSNHSSAPTYKVNKHKTSNSPNANPYSNPLAQEVVKAGNVSICLSQARLYGIKVSDDGKIKFPSSAHKNNNNNNASSSTKEKLKTQLLKSINVLSQPNPHSSSSNSNNNNTNDNNTSSYIDDEYIEDKIKLKLFKKKAMSAMRNPRCGYDFVDRLQDRGDILDRLSSTGNGNSGNGGGTDKNGYTKAQKDVMEQYYAVKLDKLACPKCKKPQSFDEFYEKKRNCSQCNERFITLVVCNIHNFEKRMKENQEKKEARLNQIENELYSTLGKPLFMSKSTNNNSTTMNTTLDISRQKNGSNATTTNNNTTTSSSQLKKSIRPASSSSSSSSSNDTMNRTNPRPVSSSSNNNNNSHREKYNTLESLQKEAKNQSEAIQQFNEKASKANNSNRNNGMNRTTTATTTSPRPSSSSSSSSSSSNRNSSANNNKNNMDLSKTAPASSQHGTANKHDTKERNRKEKADNLAMTEKFRKLLDLK